jgi:phosphopantetheinyl transferase (holo-ACP synthase)
LLFFENDYCRGVVAGIESIDLAETAFLSVSELQQLQRIKNRSYRQEWQVARYCAKMLSGIPQWDWTEIDIVSRNNKMKGIRPVLYFHGEKFGRDLTLSHAGGFALACLAKQEEQQIGCDIVPENSINNAVIRRFFLPKEQHGIPEEIWAVKETAYKAANENIGFQPLHWQTEQVGEHQYICINNTGTNTVCSDKRFVHTVVFRHAHCVLATGYKYSTPRVG